MVYVRKVTQERITHKRIHDEYNIFTCDTCKVTFTRVDTLKRHYYQLHGVSETFLCDLCRREIQWKR